MEKFSYKVLFGLSPLFSMWSPVPRSHLQPGCSHLVNFLDMTGCRVQPHVLDAAALGMCQNSDVKIHVSFPWLGILAFWRPLEEQSEVEGAAESRLGALLLSSVNVSKSFILSSVFLIWEVGHFQGFYRKQMTQYLLQQARLQGCFLVC